MTVPAFHAHMPNSPAAEATVKVVEAEPEAGARPIQAPAGAHRQADDAGDVGRGPAAEVTGFELTARPAVVAFVSALGGDLIRRFAASDGEVEVHNVILDLLGGPASGARVLACSRACGKGARNAAPRSASNKRPIYAGILRPGGGHVSTVSAKQVTTAPVSAASIAAWSGSGRSKMAAWSPSIAVSRLAAGWWRRCPVLILASMPGCCPEHRD